MCPAGSAEGLRWQPLSGIEKPGSGTEPIHQEHVMCSRFRGSCPSDVKSAGHPEPGFPIPLTGCSAALCTPSGAQKHPGGRKHRSIPPQSQTLSSVHPKPGVEPLPLIWPGCHYYAVSAFPAGLERVLKLLSAGCVSHFVGDLAPMKEAQWAALTELGPNMPQSGACRWRE